MTARAGYYSTTISSNKTITVTTSTGNKIKIGGTEYDGFGDITIKSGTTTIVFNTSVNVICNGEIKVTGGTLNLQLGDLYGTPDKTLCRSASNKDNYLINMDSGTALNIKGTESKQFIIHGRGSFSTTGSNEDGWNAILSTNMIASTKGLIRLNSGTINFDYLTLRSNYYDALGGAIDIIGTNKILVEMNNCIICNNYSKRSGAGIYANNSNESSKLTMKGCTVSNCFCYAENSGHGGTLRTQVNNKCQIFLENCNFESNKSKKNGGAIFCASPFIKLNIKDCSFDGNFAGNYGGAIYTVSQNIITGETKFQNNYTKASGGAIAFATYTSESLTLSSEEFKPNSCSLNLGSGLQFKNNTACISGGAVYLLLRPINITTTKGKEYTVFTDSDGKQISMNVEINGATIENNHANNGGGIAIERTTDIYLGDLKSNYGSFSDNGASNNGGAIHIISTNDGKVYGSSPWPKSNMNLNFGTSSTTDVISLKSNSAKNGGAVFVAGTGHLTTLRNCQIGGTPTEANEATANGGGFYIDGGNIVMENGIFMSNTAEGNGGGAYVTGGDVVVKNGSLKSNTAVNGGGLYTNGGSLSFENGALADNTATNNGGGAFVNGGTVTFSDGELKSNTAKNGGGIFLASGASMTFTDGLIAQNRALMNDNVITTAYNAKSAVSDVNGCGGGIYLQSGASEAKKTALTINVVNGFGLYGNTADRAGDDIVAEGVNTSVTVPNVTAMDLQDFDGKDAQPNWYEDYVYVEGGSDSGYADHSILKYSGGSGKRFKQMIVDGTGDYYNHLVTFSDDSKTYPNGGQDNGYVCLSLGYITISAIIRAMGLNEKESMYFTLEQLVKPDGASDWTVKNTYPVLVTGNGDGPVERTVRNLMPGYYRVKQFQSGATPWAWAYTVTDPSDGVIQKKVTKEDGTDNLFPFTVKHVEGDTNVLHDEEYKVNKMLDNAAIVPNIGVEDYKKKNDVHVKF